jgi:hypothetical protein
LPPALSRKRAGTFAAGPDGGLAALLFGLEPADDPSKDWSKAAQTAARRTVKKN